MEEFTIQKIKKRWNSHQNLKNILVQIRLNFAVRPKWKCLDVVFSINRSLLNQLEQKNRLISTVIDTSACMKSFLRNKKVNNLRFLNTFAVFNGRDLIFCLLKCSAVGILQKSHIIVYWNQNPIAKIYFHSKQFNDRILFFLKIFYLNIRTFTKNLTA